MTEQRERRRDSMVSN